jgi:hypothetical protein
MSRPLLPLFAAILWSCSSTATGEGTGDGGTPPPDPLAELLEEPSEKLRARGYNEKEAHRFAGFLIEGKADVHPVELRSGRCATFIAGTSAALAQLELLIYDGGGTEVARAAGSGARPVVHYCPSRAGVHYFVVRAGLGNGLYATRGFDSPPGLAGRFDDLFGAPARAPEPPHPAPPARP